MSGRKQPTKLSRVVVSSDGRMLLWIGDKHLTCRVDKTFELLGTTTVPHTIQVRVDIQLHC